MIDKSTLKRRLRQGLRIAAEAANVAAAIGPNPSALGLASVAVKLANGLIGSASPTPIEGWVAVDVACLARALLDEARRASMLTRHPGTGPDNSFYVGTINGLRVGWQDGGHWYDGPYTDPTCDSAAADAAAALRAFLWQHAGPALVYGRPEPGAYATLDAEDAEVLASAKAAEIWERQRAFLAAGFRCSVLLHGEPGTGKTNVARYVAERAGGLCLRIRARDVEELTGIGKLVKYLQPSAVIIDDLCRAPKKEGVLDMYDVLIRSAPLVIVTVNDVEKLDPAVYRRFNALDVYHVARLDDAVLDRMLAGVPVEAARRLRELPIKYVEDYRREAAVFGHAQAMQAVEQLVARRDEVLRMCEGAAVPVVETVPRSSGEVVQFKKAES